MNMDFETGNPVKELTLAFQEYEYLSQLYQLSLMSTTKNFREVHKDTLSLAKRMYLSLEKKIKKIESNVSDSYPFRDEVFELTHVKIGNITRRIELLTMIISEDEIIPEKFVPKFEDTVKSDYYLTLKLSDLRTKNLVFNPIK